MRIIGFLISSLLTFININGQEEHCRQGAPCNARACISIRGVSWPGLQKQAGIKREAPGRPEGCCGGFYAAGAINSTYCSPAYIRQSLCRAAAPAAEYSSARRGAFASENQTPRCYTRLPRTFPWPAGRQKVASAAFPRGLRKISNLSPPLRAGILFWPGSEGTVPFSICVTVS